MKTICLYHANCFDGMAAAWVVLRKYPNAILIPAQYGTPYKEQLEAALGGDLSLERISARILMVDFSSTREAMKSLYTLTNGEFRCIDHHKTAQEECEGLEFCVFDMNESGATLTWKYFFPDEPMPLFLRYIKDRDLWLHKEPHSQEINAWIQSFDMTPEEYEYTRIYLERDFEKSVEQGKAILRYKQRQVKAIVMQARMMFIQGHKVPVVNSNTLMSEVGHELCVRYPEAAFGAYYFDRADGVRQWGARSIGEFDVSAVAKKYGGGGHRNAAGWQTPTPD